MSFTPPQIPGTGTRIWVFLSASPGTGKTSAIRRYLTSLPPSLFQSVYFPLATPHSSRIHSRTGSVPGRRAQLPERRKHQEDPKSHSQPLLRRGGLPPVIVLDELHLASTAVLSELRLIFNFNMDSENPFIVILAGQPALRVVLSYNIHTPLRQRIALVHTMRGLAKEETSKYIESRLKMAGCTEPLFSESACAAIHSITNGWPPARKQHSHQLSALCL